MESCRCESWCQSQRLLQMGRRVVSATFLEYISASSPSSAPVSASSSAPDPRRHYLQPPHTDKPQHNDTMLLSRDQKTLQLELVEKHAALSRPGHRRSSARRLSHSTRPTQTMNKKRKPVKHNSNAQKMPIIKKEFVFDMYKQEFIFT